MNCSAVRSPGSADATALPEHMQLNARAADEDNLQADTHRQSAPAIEQLAGGAPAWLNEAQTEGRYITDTMCHSGIVGTDCDIVLLHLPTGIDVRALHSKRICLPNQDGTAVHIDGSEIEIARGNASECQGVYVLGAKDGTVSASRVVASYQLRRCLSDVEPEEEPIDDAVLDRLLAAEQDAHFAATAEDVSTKRYG